MGWVEALKISYSQDGLQWSKVLGNDGQTARVFPANFDETTAVTQYLERMISARYVRISPVRWHKNIGLRLELLGCYKPYSVVLTTTSTPRTFQTETQAGKSSCNSCAGLLLNPALVLVVPFSMELDVLPPRSVLATSAKKGGCSLLP